LRIFVDSADVPPSGFGAADVDDDVGEDGWPKVGTLP
jgi:hypothetical protein